MYFFTVPEVINLKSRCSPHSLQRLWGITFPRLLHISDCCQQSLMFLGLQLLYSRPCICLHLAIYPLCVFCIFTWCSPLCVCLCFSSYKDTLIYDDSSELIISAKTPFSHSQVPWIRISSYLFGGDNPTHTKTFCSFPFIFLEVHLMTRGMRRNV